MPRVKPCDRKRAKRPKTRTGCRTCKIRRVKCDEARPDCFRCQSTGRSCDGYDFPSPPASVCDDLILKQINPALAIFGSTQDYRAFRFFEERTSRQLSGFYDCEFWNRIILQAAHTDPGIRHAIIALGSLHESFEEGGEIDKIKDEFVLTHYNLAIRQQVDNRIQTDLSKDSLNNYVASCLIFICIEVMRGHYASALSLIQGAVQLFYDTNTDDLKSSAWPLQVFEGMLSRLQAQAVGLVGAHAIEKLIPPRLQAATNPSVPEKFGSIREARDCLELYSHSHALRARCEGLGQALRTQPALIACYLDIIARWSSAFDALLVDLGDDVSERDMRALNVLKIWQAMMVTSIDMVKYAGSDLDEQCLWDLYPETSAKVVALAESVIARPELDAGRDVKMAHLFTLDFGIVGPLYDIARMCRDPVVRRKAIDLLRANSCREGLWDSSLAARAAERQMELEESAVAEVRCAADIPAWARVGCTEPTFQVGERWLIVGFKGQRPPWKGGEEVVHHEIIEW